MKILVVGYYYSWSSSVGSRRVRGVVKGLVADGHEVLVVCAQPPPELLTEPDPGAKVLLTPASDRVSTARRVLARVRPPRSSPSTADTATPPAAAPTARPGTTQRVQHALRNSARQWVGFPDTMWEWTYRAQRAVRRAGFDPDVIIASAPPMAALHSAARLARRHGCPWIADMRDLWTGDPYRVTPRIVHPFDRWLERRVLSSAAAITTVATSLAEELHALCPTVTVTPLRNGFDEEWLRHGDEPPARPATVVFTGTLTANTGRSLAPLCDAADGLNRLGGPTAPIIEVVGAVDRSIRDLVSARGLDDRIHFLGTVSGADARRAQQQACALLNFSWEDPRDFSKMPAKLFEYAAARRPVVHLGKVETLGTLLIADHHLGFLADPDDPEAVARLLIGLADGTVAWLPPSAEDLVPLTHRAMVDGFRRVIADVAAEAQPTG